jgi:putative modified peptide
MSTRFSMDVVRRLLQALGHDDAFRAAFVADPRAALRSIGHETPAADRDRPGRDPVLPMKQLRGGLASKQYFIDNADTMAATYEASQDDANAMVAFGPFDMCAG